MKPTFAMHSYPWYMADWKNSETRITLTMAERGLYRELLDHCYAEGSIPDDERKLAAIAGCSINELRKLWPQVKQCFSSNGVQGRLEHKRVNDVLYRLEKWNEARRRGGHERQVKRAAKADVNQAIADTPVSGTSSTSTTTSTTELEEHTAAIAAEATAAPKPPKQPSATDLRVQEIAAAMVAEHPPIRSCDVGVVVTRLKSIAKLFPPVDRLHELAEIQRRHHGWCGSHDWTKDGGQFAKGLKAWLSPTDGFWRREPPAPSLALVPTRASPGLFDKSAEVSRLLDERLAEEARKRYGAV